MGRNTALSRMLLMVILGFAPAALAQQAAILTYKMDYFAGTQLSTAYDLVGRLPGFVYDNGNSNRGYSGSAGNVLIDGTRPTAKTDDLQTVLQRIAIARVDHVEVIRGGAPGIDMQGQAVIANIILKREDSTTTILTLSNNFYGSGHDVPFGNVEFTRKSGDEVYDITFSRYGTNADDSPGTGTTSFSPVGKPAIVTAAERKGLDRLGWGLNGSVLLPFLGGKFGANFTGQATIYNSGVIYGAPKNSVFFSSQKRRPLELGTHWDGAWGAANLTLLGLQRLDHQRNLNTSDISSGHEVFRNVRNTGESIMSLRARYDASEDLTLESGVEGAYNFLNGLSSDVLNGTAKTVTGANTRVHEGRGEIFAQASWKISAEWALEAGLRGEVSAIAAQGVPARLLSFPKPRLLLSWSPLPNNQFRLRYERLVGQLDFSNFIASSDLAGSGVSAGNVRLRPDRRWQLEGIYEAHFWTKGALLLSWLHEDITDLVDYIPIGGGSDGPGNVPKAVNDRFDVEFSLPLDDAGLDGGIFKTSLKWYDSALKDPVTGQTRSISNQRDRALNFIYTQDMPAWNSSLEMDFTPSGFSQPTYRIAQVTKFRLAASYFTFIWDWRPAPDIDLLFRANNAIPYLFEQEQDIYSGPRNTSPLSEIDEQRIVTNPRFQLQLRKTF